MGDFSFKKGQKVKVVLVGPGDVTSTEEFAVFKVDKKGVWLDNGPGNDPLGPYDKKTGRHVDTGFEWLSMSIVPLEE